MAGVPGGGQFDPATMAPAAGIESPPTPDMLSSAGGGATALDAEYLMFLSKASGVSVSELAMLAQRRPEVFAGIAQRAGVPPPDTSVATPPATVGTMLPPDDGTAGAVQTGDGYLGGGPTGSPPAQPGMMLANGGGGQAAAPMMTPDPAAMESVGQMLSGIKMPAAPDVPPAVSPPSPNTISPIDLTQILRQMGMGMGGGGQIPSVPR